MAGLLDMGEDGDLASTGFLRGLLGASQQRKRPFTMLLGGLAGMQQAQAMAAQQAQDRAFAERKLAIEEALKNAQAQEFMAQADQRRAAVSQAQDEQRRQQAFSADLQPRAVSPTDAMAGGGGPTVGNAARIGQQQPIDWQALALKWPREVETLRKVAEAKNFGRDEIAGQFDTTMPGTNRPATGFRSKYDVLPMAAPKAVQMETVNQGDRISLRDPYAGSPGDVFSIFQDPNSKASNAVTMRGQNMTDARSRERLAFDMATADAGKWQYDATRGVQVNPKTGEARPVTMDGKPIEAKDKELTDAQAKALLFGSRTSQAENVFRDMEKRGTVMPGQIKSGVDRLPLVGEALGDVVNVLPRFAGGPNADQQSVEQAQRDFVNAVLRRESGAVISPAEFANAKRQYFPVMGDSDQVIAQKRKNRELATAGLLAEVPAAKRKAFMQQNTGGASGSFDAPNRVRYDAQGNEIRD